ncbi:MAG: choice-of-anchor L domain-containing protein, partial [Bacteroidota bacterium]|nr:choice-of-anchor L domain-containing protein [Bacteroidota bacterium]
MKKIYLLVFFLCCNLTGFSQFVENFNGGIPADWATLKILNGNVVTGSGVPEWGETPTAFEHLICEGTGAAFVGRMNIGMNNTSESWLVTPQITVPDNGRLYFLALQTLGADFGTTYQVRISTTSQTDHTSFTTTLISLTENELSNFNECREHGIQPVIDLQPYANQNVYIAFVKVDTQPSSGTSADRWLLDNVRVLAECPALTNIQATADIDSATITWNDNGAMSWEVVLVEGNNVPNDGVVDYTVNTNTVNITGLNPATQYTYYIRSLCDGNYSDWTNAQTFNTTLCNASQTCTFSFILYDDYGDGWNGNTMSVSQNGIIVENLTFSDGSTHQIDVGLCNGIPFSLTWNPGGFYSQEVGITIISPTGEQLYQMTPNTNTPGTTLFTDVVNCTPPTCPRPNNLTATNINDTSVDLAWTETGTATQWEVVILPTGSAFDDSNAVTVNTNPYTFTGLGSGVLYDFYVRAVCDTNDTSTWSVPITFQTDLCPASQRCAYKFILTDQYGDGWTGNTMTVSQNGVIIQTLSMSSGSQQEIMVDLCDGVPFSLFWNIGGGFAGEVGIIVENPFQEVLYEKPAGTGQQNSNLYTGSVNCTAPTCLSPVNPTVSDVIDTQATFSWTEQGTATQWEIAIEPEGTGAPSGNNSFIVNENPYTHTGLNPATKYEYYVRAICDANDVSIWSGPRYFETMVCHPDDQCLYSFYMNSTSSWGWDSARMQIIQNGAIVHELIHQSATPQTIQVALCNGIPFDIVWSVAGFSPNVVALEVTDSHNGFVFAMLPGEGTPNTTLYSGIVSCGVSNCPNPSDITISNITQTSAVVDWVETGTTTQWEYVALPVGELPNNNTVFTLTDTHPITIDNLNSGTSYRIYIRAVCSASDSSGIVYDTFQTLSLPAITVNTTQYTIPELVEDIFIKSDCAEISNISWSTGTNFNSVNGIGYFEKNNSSFPFTDGIILSTGNVDLASGPKTITTQSQGLINWNGDNDLNELLLSIGNTNGLLNATVLEFDFKAITDQISFDFIFASEEYGIFQCSYSDVFAFFLTDLETGVTTNLAVVPNTNIPISVTTIRNQLYNPSCSSENEQYFANFYPGNDIASANAPINFRGHTVPLTASSAVVPNKNYHIKLAIADYSDMQYDSAVFLAGGSFNFGEIDLGADLLVIDNTALCANGSHTLVSGIDTNIFQISWYHNDVLIPGENAATLVVTQSGTYTAVASNGTCNTSDSVVVEFFENLETIIAQPNNLTDCGASGTNTFDLSVNTPVILANLDPTLHTVEYYVSQNDAQNGVNAITDLQNFANTANPQTIYVRVYRNNTVCYAYTSFELQITTPNQAITDFSYDNTNYCLADNNPVITLNPNITPSGVFTATPSLNGLNSTTGEIDLSQTSTGTYTITYTVTDSGCTAGGSSSFVINLIESCLIPRGISPNGDGMNDV